MALKIRKEDALKYHKNHPKGKIEVSPTKPLSSQHDLALAYSPGVAEPCKEIATNKDAVYDYTAKGNLIGVISNGSAVLGLGNIGAEASKPVMEGKGVLFKKFAGIDVFDIEINCSEPGHFISTVKALEPTFGGINLEDIKAPECFYIEQEIKRLTKIPVMHDDQHGTAIITGAALINALEIAGKDIEKIKMVMAGAGAASISCARLYTSLGVKSENIIMTDINGVIRQDRNNLQEHHKPYATNRDIYTLEEALIDADVFVGLSAGNILGQESVKKMAANPIVFALANPDPEIEYNVAMEARKDIIMATGRSDHPNQVNNVLGFPYIFRGALDVGATEINEEMKLAAVKALAGLAKETVPDYVNKAYGDMTLAFGKNYLIPKPLDPRLITRISPAVAKAAIDSGVSRKIIEDWHNYELELLQRVGMDQKLISKVMAKARSKPKRVVFAEADTYKILKSAQIIEDEGIGQPVLIGEPNKIQQILDENNIELENSHRIDMFEDEERLEKFAQALYEKRKRRGITLFDARRMVRERNYFGAMLVESGEADVLISGLTRDYPKIMLPALHILGVKQGVNRVAGMYIVQNKKGTFFFADTTVNIDPSIEELVEIIGLTADTVRTFDIEPRIAVLSYSNFGSSKGNVPEKAMKAREKAKEKFPELVIEGDIQADVALNTELQQINYPFSELADSGANTFIFPELASGNIGYKLLYAMGESEIIGPILMGMGKPVHILQLGSSVREIVNMVAIAVQDANLREEEIPS